ncbi:heparin lyase I family protein [Saccharospirillum alexandrii]|uniref:heparin lyase I family protein n=1 Tax=Saccharospirillum alexandrii TaxID=2448477 RepID=UPI0037362230
MKTRASGFVFAIGVIISSGAIAESYVEDFEGGLGSSNFFKWGSEAYTDISSDKAYSGNESLRFRFMGDTDLNEDAWAEKRFELDRIYSELWIRYKLWVPENYFHRNGDGPDNNKGLIMLWSDDYSGISHTSLHFTRPRDINSSGESASNPGGSALYGTWKPNSGVAFNFFNPYDLSDDSPSMDEMSMGILSSDRGRWIDWVIHAKVSDLHIEQNDIDGPGNGKLQVWKDGELIYNVTDATNYTEVDGMNGWDQGYILGWANSGFDETTYMHVDDFMIGVSAEDVGFELMKPSFGNVIKQID